MYLQILIGFIILIFGAIVSRFMHASQFKRLDTKKQDALLANTRRLRMFALVPAFVAVIIFIVGIVNMPDMFFRLFQLMGIYGTAYIILFNLLVVIQYYRARCGIIFFVVALFSKLVFFTTLILFCYLVIVAFQ